MVDAQASEYFKTAQNTINILTIIMKILIRVYTRLLQLCASQ